MRPEDIDKEISKNKSRNQQLEDLKKIKSDEFGPLVIDLFEDFSPCRIQHTRDGCFVEFKHELNFQGTNQMFQEFAKKTGMIPTGWWHDNDGKTTVAFDKVFYPDSSALVTDDDDDNYGY